MRLTYIYHSCFVIEAANFTMIIDYYKDSINEKQGVIHDRILHRPQKLYVLSSHSHHDHFNKEVLEWKKERTDIEYIFSDDIKPLIKDADCQEISFISKGEIYTDNLITIAAYGSTDLGISFKIIRGNNVLFHAGDLNNWHWNEESTLEEITQAETAYEQELDLLARNTPSVDLAMFPVDPRLGKDYMKGAEQFMAKIRTKLFAPMHFDMAYDKAEQIEDIAKQFDTNVFIPHSCGEIYKGEVE